MRGPKCSPTCGCWWACSHGAKWQQGGLRCPSPYWPPPSTSLWLGQVRTWLGWRRLPASPCKSTTSSTLEVGRERHCGVCPYGFQYALVLSSWHPAFLPKFKPCWQAALLDLPQNHSDIPLKPFPPAPTIHIINPLFHTTQTGSVSPITPWLIHIVQVRRLGSSPSFTTASLCTGTSPDFSESLFC